MLQKVLMLGLKKIKKLYKIRNKFANKYINKKVFTNKVLK